MERKKKKKDENKEKNKRKTKAKIETTTTKKAAFMFLGETITNEGFFIKKISTHPVKDKFGTTPPTKT